MSNIVIYASKPMPELEASLAEIDETEIRTVSIDQIKDYAIMNPSLMIIENIETAKDALMTNKFPCPILFLGNTRRDITVRSEGFDFISNINNKLIRGKPKVFPEMINCCFFLSKMAF